MIPRESIKNEPLLEKPTVLSTLITLVLAEASKVFLVKPGTKNSPETKDCSLNPTKRGIL